MELFQAIHARRSVRKYTGQKTSREDLLRVVDAGRMAASGNNFQPWEFIVVTNQQTIERLTIAASWMDKAGAIIAVVLDPTSRWWVEDGAAAVQNMLLAATALGYGACWLEGYTLSSEQELKHILGIPTSLRLFTLVPIGVPDEMPQKDKKLLDQLVHWEQW